MKEGNLIRLRDWQTKDLKEFEFWHAGTKRWMAYDAPYYPKPTKEEINFKSQELRKNISASNWPTPPQRLVIAVKNSNQLIGTVSWYWQSEETNWMSIGIILYDEEYWGKGIGYEALSLWIDYLFESCRDIVRLDLRTWSGNERMISLSKKLGFKEEARFRKARVVDGIFYDSIGLGLLKEEWRSE